MPGHDGPLKARARALPEPARAMVFYPWALSTGRWPARWSGVVQRARTRHPSTFDEKLLYKMARDRRPILTVHSDKLRVREYAAARIGPEHLTPLLAQAATGGGIDWASLPREFACKVNHASGGVIVVSTRIDARRTLPRPADRPGWAHLAVHPDASDATAIAELCDYWLGRGYGWTVGAYREWGYRDVPRRILVEELVPSAAVLPREVKVYCLNGVPRCVWFVQRGGDFTSADDELFLEGEWGAAAHRSGMSTDQWRRLLEMCTALAAGTDQVRVDWLLMPDGSPRLGELTSYSQGAGNDWGCHATLSAEQVDRWLSLRWQVPGHYA